MDWRGWVDKFEKHAKNWELVEGARRKLQQASASAQVSITVDPRLTGDDFVDFFAVDVVDFFEVDVLLLGPDGSPLSNATLDVDAAMPHHRHGMNHRSHMVDVGSGRWRAEDMLFHMPGAWVLYFDVKQDGVVRRAQVDVEVD